MFHGMADPILLTHLFANGHLPCYSLLMTIMHSTAMNIDMQMVGPEVNPIISLWRNPHAISKSDLPHFKLLPTVCGS